MLPDLDRRGLLAAGAASLGSWLLDPAAGAVAQPAPPDLPPGFPAHESEAVQAVVGASHGNFERVRELVNPRPELAKASWDWGFGDWESALGAAAHTGNRDIALYLIEHGARPNLFSAAMLGHLDVVRAHVEASPGIQSLPGPHGIPLLVHARLGGEEGAPVVAYLQEIGGADGATDRPDAPHDLEAYLGTFRFGEGPDGVFETLLGRRGNLMLQRGPEGTPRGLVHIGESVFHPAGAPSVRVRFEILDGRAGAVEISAPPHTVKAYLPPS